MFAFPLLFPSSCHPLSRKSQPLLSLSYLSIFLQSLCFISLHCSPFATLSDSSPHAQSPVQRYIKEGAFIRVWRPPSFGVLPLSFSAAFSRSLYFLFSPPRNIPHFHTRHSALSHRLMRTQYLSVCWVRPLVQSHLPRFVT